MIHNYFNNMNFIFVLKTLEANPKIKKLCIVKLLFYFKELIILRF